MTLSDFRTSAISTGGCPVAVGGIHQRMYIGSRNIHFTCQPVSFRRGTLTLLAVVAVGFLIPARSAAQSTPPSSASTQHAQSPAKSQPRQAKLQATHPHAGTGSRTRQTHDTASRHVAARPATGKSAGNRSTTAKLAAAKPAPTKSAAKSGKKRGSSKNAHLSSSQARRVYMAHLHPGADRVTAIQQKLAEVGYLKEEPNGQWDDQTREAMRRYQEDYGFPATGLPEAKSLMKLGLGPHPLPPELDHTTAANTTPSGSR